MRLDEKIAKLKAQMKELQAIGIRLNDLPDKQVSLTNLDARSMMMRGAGIVGYNVQTAVDSQHHLIVAYEVTNVGSDCYQISSMSKAPDMMRIRKRTVGHPFGTLEQWMGAMHFLTRRLEGVSAEMSFHVLAYNMKRVMKILGTTSLMQRCRVERVGFVAYLARQKPR